MRRFGIVMAGLLALALLLPGLAAASPPQTVSFTGTFTEGSSAGTFYDAEAPLCASGTTEDLAGVAGGFQSGKHLQLVVLKEFTCAGGDDTFTLLLQVHIQFDPYENHFTWVVMGGTGDFADLHGQGTGTSEPTLTGGIDAYEGAVHID
jgi:hypothetical protein